VTTPDPATVAAAALAAVQFLQSQAGMAQLAPAWASIQPNRADLPPLQCRACGNPLDGDTWPEYVQHLNANHHSLLEQYAGMAGVDVPRVRTKGADKADWPVDHEALAAVLTERAWPHDPGIRVQRNG
jgi:hypothetical protein